MYFDVLVLVAAAEELATVLLVFFVVVDATEVVLLLDDTLELAALDKYSAVRVVELAVVCEVEALEDFVALEDWVVPAAAARATAVASSVVMYEIEGMMAIQ